jgi:hypothetical protein
MTVPIVRFGMGAEGLGAGSIEVRFEGHDNESTPSPSRGRS